MPLQLPNLDDRTYQDLVQEAIGLIPTYDADWDNYNPSDPGITLIELFAYLAEMLIYRLNRVTDTNKYTFLKLLNGPDWVPEKALNEEMRETILKLRHTDRAVTGADFETLTLEVNQTLPANEQKIARARCVPRRNLESENPLAPSVDRPGHISIVIVPDDRVSSPQPNATLIQAVQDYLEPRRLITTQLHVVGPRYFTIGIQLTLVLKPDAVEGTVKTQAINALQQFFDPLTGGVERQGWQFGRNVYVSEIYQLLDTLPGVDYVTPTKSPTETVLDEITISPEKTDRRQLNAQGQLIGIEIQPDELVDAQINPNAIQVVPTKTSTVTNRLRV